MSFANNFTYKESEKIFPRDEFYEVFSEEEIFEIINNLETDHEIDNKFSYKGDGWILWNNFYERHSKTVYEIPAINNQLIQIAIPCLQSLLEGRKILNLIDTRANNCISSQFFVKNILENHSSYKIKSYTTTCISKDLSKSNLKKVEETIERFRNSKNLDFETKLNYLSLDLENYPLKNIAYSIKENSEKESNIFLNIGHGLINSKNQLRMLENYRNAMEPDDILILTLSLPSEKKMTDFQSVQLPDNNKKEYVLKLLGFDVEKLRVSYNYLNGSKNLSYILDSDYELNVKVGKRNRKIFLKNKSNIIVWRNILKSLSEVLVETKIAGLDIKFFATNENSSDAILICKKNIFNYEK